MAYRVDSFILLFFLDDSFSDYESDELEVLNPDTDSGVISPRLVEFQISEMGCGGGVKGGG